MVQQPRHAEDYLPGSSDRPTYGGTRSFRAETSSLEVKITALTVKCFDPQTRQIDIEKTNDQRRQLASDLGLKPVVWNKDGTHFRRVIYDAQGLFTVRYTTQVPPHIETLGEHETIPSKFAAQYLGVEDSVLNQLVVNGTIRRIHSQKQRNPGVYLADLNRHKASEQ